MSRRKTLTISIILLAVVLFLLFTRAERVQRGDIDYRVVRRLDVGGGRTIMILLDDTPFEVPGWLYEIHVDGQIVVPTTMLEGCCRPEVNPGFEILSSRDNKVIGVVWTTRPGVLLVAHDFASGASWPRPQAHETLESGLDRGRRLRDILAEDNRQTKLALSYEVP